MDWSRLFVVYHPHDDGRGFSNSWRLPFRLIDSLATVIDGVARLLLWVPFGYLPPSLSIAVLDWGCRVACAGWNSKLDEDGVQGTGGEL